MSKVKSAGGVLIHLLLVLVSISEGQDAPFATGESALDPFGSDSVGGGGGRSEEESSSKEFVYTVNLNSSLGQSRAINVNGFSRRNTLRGGGVMSEQAQIVFPQSHTSSFQGQRPNKYIGQKEKAPTIPIHVLRTLSSESDFSQIIRKFVQNVDIKATETGEQILVGRKGETIQDKNGHNIVISTFPSPQLSRGAPGVPVVSERNNQKVTQVLRVPSLERMGGPTTRLKTLEKSPPVAVCRPEETTVQLPVTYDPHIIYYPRCVRVERCGGCCGSDILACEPSEITTVNVAVRQLAYVGDGNTSNLEFLKQEDVPLEKHTKCECRCRTKPEDCGVRHEYKEHECLCVCRNQSEHEECVAHAHKVWDTATCECACREIKDCNSGFFFDLKTCQCTQLPSTKKRRGRRNQTKTV